ncbi:MAG: hypothetical protein HFE75_02040 [Firmicutes bacterium]|jgi:hypothetical protein|nr:hypothetical protein [Bacillota bacterium]NBI62894.1 hypothetical protein [Clostridiales bacterium]
MRNKKVFIILAVFILYMSSASTVFATEGTISDPFSFEKQKGDAVELTKEMLNLSQNEHKQIKHDYQDLAQAINAAGKDNVEEVIKKHSSDDLLIKKIEAIAGTYRKNSSLIPHFSIKDSDLVTEYKFNNQNIEIGPHYVAVEETTGDRPQMRLTAAKATKKTKGGCATRIYYAKPYGYKLFEISVGLYFYYDGTKASYKSDFDAYYKRYLGSALYSVSNWRKKRETAGTSYQGWCGGNFSEGITIKGNGLVWFDYVVKHKVKCSKSGNITRTYTVK